MDDVYTDASRRPVQQEIAMSLQEKLDAFKADFETNKAPPQAVQAFHRSNDELIGSGPARTKRRRAPLTVAA